MQYMGGKTRLAKGIADLICAQGPVHVWEPFCGGLSISTELVKRGCTVLCTDIQKSLISLYQAMQKGWDPPQEMPREAWDLIKTDLIPDTDPLKAFTGFGCSYRGLYFGGWAHMRVDEMPDGTFTRWGDPYACTARRSLQKQFAVLTPAKATFANVDFLDIPVSQDTVRTTPVIYCDPPYADTAPYEGTKKFDHARFWARAESWTRHGTCVLVSEYKAPAGWEVLWEKKIPVMRGKHGTEGTKNGGGRTERLFVYNG